MPDYGKAPGPSCPGQVATQLQPPASTLPRLPGLLDEAGLLLLRDGRIVLGQL